MHDYIVVTMWSCVTNQFWSTTMTGTSGTYTVAYEPTPMGPCQHDYTCTCGSYKHRHGVDTNGHCKHIREVIERGLRCGWDEFMDGDQATEDGRCPWCGGDTFVSCHGV